jgi:hypothetical protein
MKLMSQFIIPINSLISDAIYKMLYTILLSFDIKLFVASILPRKAAFDILRVPIFRTEFCYYFFVFLYILCLIS